MTTDLHPKKRPTVAEWVPRFLLELRAQGIVLRACEKAGIARQTAYDRREKHDDFRKVWDAALQDAADVLEEEAWKRATEGFQQEVYQDGEQVGTVTRKSDTLLIFLLKGIRREKYSDSTRVEHRGKIEGPPNIIVLQIGDRPARIIDLETVDVRTLQRDELDALRQLREGDVIEGEAREV